MEIISQYPYDYLIVGAGLTGAVLARELTNNGKKCVVIDKRDHLGGNCYTKNVNGINVHWYGPHIFHTNNKVLWEYVNQYAEFNMYYIHGRSCTNGQFYQFPINLDTLRQLWGVSTPGEAQRLLDSKKIIGISPFDSAENWCLANLGEELYETFFSGYIHKQWGMPASAMPASIVQRIPMVLTTDPRYHKTAYSGVPLCGYTKMFENMLQDIDVVLNMPWQNVNSINYDKIIFTGCIGEFFDYQFGALEYRSLLFRRYEIPASRSFGTPVVFFPDINIPYTRMTESGHFTHSNPINTTITIEYPDQYKMNENDPYYPIHTNMNIEVYNKYKQLSSNYRNVILAGRLGSYKYINMDQAVGAALKLACTLLI